MQADDVKRILVVGAGPKEEKDRPPRELEKRVKRGDLGRKSGRGFYDYSTDSPKLVLD